MPVRVLAPETASRIAAGEVVERPSSVVKELVENALDAGATEISAEATGGGLELIRVADNGCGIPAGEVSLAFERHATSKITSITDLASIATLGFRGEALPSVASVSHVTVLTRARGEEAGTYLELQEGRRTREEPRGAAQGTVVAVRHLFRNVPARLKFVKSRSTEAGRIQHVVHQYMLAYPEVRFALQLEERAPQVSGGTGHQRDAAAVIHGAETAAGLLELPETREGGVTVTGLVSPPSVTKSHRNAMTLLVNRRWVQSRVLAYALEEAYRGFLQERRHPMAVVNITLPEDGVDVNVHPAKSEVRFREESRVFAALQRAVREALVHTSPVPAFSSQRLPRSGGIPLFPSRAGGTVDANPGPSDPDSAPSSRAAAGEPGVPSPADREERPTATHRDRLPVLRMLGQLQDTYVVAEGPGGMYLVDQHAAHERVVYERIKEEREAGQASSQGLLEPTVVEVPPALEEAFREHRDRLQWYGFQLEEFGTATYLIRAVPAPLAEGDPAQALVQLLGDLAQGRSAADAEEQVIQSVACHGSIRAGKRLDLEEMRSLLRQLELCAQPHTCPHGRPTLMHLSASDLAREFGRR